jgi:hypothetical protein
MILAVSNSMQPPIEKWVPHYKQTTFPGFAWPKAVAVLCVARATVSPLNFHQT